MIEALVGAMSMHPASGDLQQCGLQCCAELAGHAKGRELLIQSGALALAMAAMKKWPGHVGIQTAACASISKLCQGSSRSQLYAVKGGAVKLILKASRCHIWVAALQSTAHEATLCLLAHPAAAQAILEGRGLQYLLHSLQAHKADATVARASLRLLGALAEMEAIQADLSADDIAVEVCDESVKPLGILALSAAPLALRWS